jgi:signal transduction histidine kinase
MTVDLSGLSQTEGSERMRAVGLDFDTTVFDIDFSLCDFGRQFDDTGDVQARRLLAVAAASLEPVDREVGRTSRLLALLSLLLTALVGSVVWITAGRSLRPVDRMRAEVELISGTGLGRRIDDPKTGDEVSRLAATMNEMLRRLEANQDREKAFVADASHELRGPLAAIRATLDVDEVHAGTADLTRSLAVVRDQTAHLQHVVEDLLLLARFDDPGYEGRRNLVDLDEVIRQAVAGMDSRPLEVSLSIMPAVVRGDEVELRRLVVNLVANACRHATHRVEVGCDERSGLVRFWVDDDGDGVPAEDQARIFERFVRLDEARSRDKGGSGLGLAICGEIARVHGGHIAVGISPLGGARFEVSVPAAG